LPDMLGGIPCLFAEPRMADLEYFAPGDQGLSGVNEHTKPPGEEVMYTK
jgi:hypothetical protein